MLAACAGPKPPASELACPKNVDDRLPMNGPSLVLFNRLRAETESTMLKRRSVAESPKML